MSETKHTPEPWGYGADLETIMTEYRDANGNMTNENWVRGGHPKIIAKVTERQWMHASESVANARRIVACVNACAGIPTEDLERGHVSVRHGNVPHMAHLWSDGIYRSHPEPGLAEIMEQRDMHRNAEMEWERAMMAAIGEDGIKSVSEAIAKLKAERDELLKAMEANA